MTGRDDTAWHDDNCSDRECDGNMFRFSVIKTTKPDRAMMLTELDDSTGRRSRLFHWTAIPLCSWRSQIFSKIFPNRRGSVDNHTIWGLDASSTLLLRICYDPTTTMKIRLRLVYADGDAATTLLRPRRWSFATYYVG